MSNLRRFKSNTTILSKNDVMIEKINDEASIYKRTDKNDHGAEDKMIQDAKDQI
jgi:hypothetical protein